ncbi:chemotaxis-specific protein-glutamate methyltransferase CheB [Caldicellulosiruptor morganii]|uniref:Protein-glutamate methylesterase/protein-glutamine glutaminase n=1 Tax=Caldicellulosiruptor morganii TaxID=1387555 RepID=A0ABY7BQ16_9FIRM|nr:chemotaxis-specific protein-glutamate methyltransferase CheB [Caldicellulosiruptor morganii]WAM33992.1 chemotaxis-specific protein-glutamate methyltransferase CheB [Caldicellulosiruptor morganii]
MKRVLIVDDSELMCEFIKNCIGKRIEDAVIFTAKNPLIAIRKARTFKMDLALIDFEMPFMNGLLLIDYLKEINHFTRIIMVSAFTEPGARITVEALSKGALDYILKPSGLEDAKRFEEELVEKVKWALGDVDYKKKKRVSKLDVESNGVQVVSRAPSVVIPKPRISKQDDLVQRVKNSEVIAIGISTGGPPVLEKIFTNLKSDFKIPILVVQHMPPTFTKALADRLARISKREIKEAEDREEIRQGVIYIAKGGVHLAVERVLGRFYTRLLDNVEKVNSHKPSCDILFSSVAEWYQDRATGIIMTGMGCDGAQGLLEMRNQGALTIAQDRESCVVYGMPRVAVEKGAAEVVMSVDEIIKLLNSV